jgi:hypothetical protein
VPKVLAGDGIEGKVEFNDIGHGGPGWSGQSAAVAGSDTRERLRLLYR